MKVIVIPSNLPWLAKEMLKEAGVKSVDEYVMLDESMIEGRLMKESKELSGILKEIKEIMESGAGGGAGGRKVSLLTLIKGKGGEEGGERRSSGEGVFRSRANLGSGEESVMVMVGKGNVVVRGRRSVVRGVIIGESKDLPVVFVKSKSPNPPAFEAGGRIYINVSNPMIKELIKLSSRLPRDEKMLLWAPIIIHEYLHVQGLDHDYPEWMPRYESAIMSVIKNYISRRIGG